MPNQLPNPLAAKMNHDSGVTGPTGFTTSTMSGEGAQDEEDEWYAKKGDSIFHDMEKLLK